LAETLSNSGCITLDLSAFSACAADESHHDRLGFRPLPSASAYVQFSSGTTGAPKGAVVTHAAALRHLQMLKECLDLAASDVLVGWAPFYHDLGLVVYLLLPLVSGTPAVVISPDSWVRHPHLLLNALSDYRGTVCVMPNFGFAHTTRNVRQRDLGGVDLRCVRHLIAGAEVVQPEILRDFAARFATAGLAAETLRVGYGMTESIFMASLTPPMRPPYVDHIDRLALLHNRHALPSVEPEALAVISCGTPLPTTSITILDEHDHPLPERRVGEVVIFSPALFAHYLHRPDLTENTLRRGKLHTGDLGYLAGGELFIVDRMKDLIIVAGRHIYPETLEQIALAVLGQAGGRAAAFGVRSTAIGTELPVLVCEVRGQFAEEATRRLAGLVRRQVMHEAEVALADVRLVRRGWLEITTSGKVSRTATRDKYLSAGYLSQLSTVQLAEIGSATSQELEQALCALAAQILGVAAVRPEDNVFAAGGDSLTAVRFILAVEEQLKVDVGPEFFQDPTVTNLLRLLGPQGTEPVTEPPQRRGPTPRVHTHSDKIHRRRWLNGMAPIVSKYVLPYALGVRLQRAWLALPGVEQMLFGEKIALLHRWGERIGTPPDAKVIRKNLLANSWKGWRNHALTAPLGASPWVTIQGEAALWQPRRSGPGVIFLVLHSPLSAIFIRGCAASGLQTLTVRGATHDMEMREQDRSLQLYHAHQILQRGGTVIIGGDGGKGKQGVIVPFFGGWRLFRQGGAELAVQTGAPLVPVFCTITTTGRVDIEVCPPLTAGGSSTQEQIDALTGAYAELVVARWPQIYHSLAWGNLARWLDRTADGRA
jgi:acyl-CoA synthetase (AMP-forming)/AMP-acid ligase II/acyl carrier protein